jgi:oxygen-dependent protoporphyrinogen oxidase
VYERLVQPLVGGIYTADAEKLSLSATLPRFLEMERRHGSLIRGARREAVDGDSPRDASAARYSMFLAPRAGMTSLVAAIESRLPARTLHRNSPVQKIVRSESGEWRLSVGSQGTGGNKERQEHRADALIIAAAAHHAGRLLGDVDPSLAANLLRIPYADSAVAIVAYRREQIGHPLDGFGFVVPEIERRQILACSFSSIKFPGRAPADGVLLRVFLGGANHGEQVDLPDEALREIVTRELQDLLKVSGAPVLFRVARWRAAMPQYHVGHQALVAEIERAAAKHQHLYLSGNAYHGVGIPDCIHSGETAAEQIVASR